MKNINKNELIELIKSISSRTCKEKPILIYQSYLSGPDQFIKSLWSRERAESYECPPLNEDAKFYASPQCKFFKAYMRHYNQAFADWCIQWQKDYRKPTIILLEKGMKYIDKNGRETFHSAFGTVVEKTLSELLGAQKAIEIENTYDVYNYSENKELTYNELQSIISKYNLE